MLGKLRVLRNSSDGLFLNEAGVVSAEMGLGSTSREQLPEAQARGQGHGMDLGSLHLVFWKNWEEGGEGRRQWIARVPEN